MSRPEPTSWDSPCAVARNLFAVDGGRQVDGDEVAVGDRPVHPGQGAESSPQGLQFGVDVVVTDLDRVHRDGQRTRVGQGELGPDVDLGGERQLLAVLLLGDLDLGLAQRVHLRLGDRLSVPRGQRVGDDLVEHRLAAEAGLQHNFAGALPGRKPGKRTCLANSL